MTREELEAVIAGAAWFSRCCRFREEPGAVALAAVASFAGWEWLPTSRDQADPIHGGALIAAAEATGLGPARREAELASTRQVLTLLRSVPEPLAALVDGPHDFTLAAKGGATYAARMATREVIAGRPGFWCRVVRLFGTGYWPCGVIAENQTLVVW